MTGRFERLSVESQLLYTEGSPVIIAASAILKDDLNGKVISQIKFENISNKIIVALFVDVKAYSVTGEELEGIKGFQYLDLNIARDISFGSQTPIYLPDNTTRKTSIKVKRVLFSDGTDWTASGDAQWAAIPTSKAREPYEDSELEKQFKLNYGNDYITVPEKIDDLWYCACGTLNKIDDNDCKKCSRNQSVLEGLDLEKLNLDKDTRLKEEAERAEQERLEKEEREHIRAEKLDIAKKKGKKIALIGGPILVAVVVFLIVLFNVIIPNVKYSNADDNYKSGNYDAAVEGFKALGDYKDSADRVIESELAKKYSECVDNIANKSYIAAYNGLVELGDYKDSETLAANIFENYKKELLKTAVVGDTVYYGSYEQDNDTSNGKENIEWQVIKTTGKKKLLLSKYILSIQCFDSDENNNEWETSSLRTWLNNDFYEEAFTDKEKGQISDSGDKAFCLSRDEILNLVTGDVPLITNTTASLGGYADSTWWTRDKFPYDEDDPSVLLVVDSDFTRYNHYQTIKPNYKSGVRPAIWIEIE